MKKIRLFLLFVALTVILTACAPNSTVELDRLGTEIQFTLPGENPSLDTAAENGKVAGFGTGLWHGLVALITLFVSFFNPSVQMYEVHNDGGWYNFGFLLGAVFLSGFFGFLGGRR
jgi:hypothetical protein